MALGWKSSGSTARAGRIEAVIGVGHVDDSRETRGSRRLDQGTLIGPSFGRPTRGISTQTIGTPPSLAVRGHRLVNARQDLPVPRPQGTLVIVGAAEPLDPGSFQRTAR